MDMDRFLSETEKTQIARYNQLLAEIRGYETEGKPLEEYASQLSEAQQILNVLFQMRRCDYTEKIEQLDSLGDFKENPDYQACSLFFSSHESFNFEILTNSGDIENFFIQLNNVNNNLMQLFILATLEEKKLRGNLVADKIRKTNELELDLGNYTHPFLQSFDSFAAANLALTNARNMSNFNLPLLAACVESLTNAKNALDNEYVIQLADIKNEAIMYLELYAYAMEKSDSSQLKSLLNGIGIERNKDNLDKLVELNNLVQSIQVKLKTAGIIKEDSTSTLETAEEEAIIGNTSIDNILTDDCEFHPNILNDDGTLNTALLATVNINILLEALNKLQSAGKIGSVQFETFYGELNARIEKTKTPTPRGLSFDYFLERHTKHVTKRLREIRAKDGRIEPHQRSLFAKQISFADAINQDKLDDETTLSEEAKDQLNLLRYSVEGYKAHNPLAKKNELFVTHGFIRKVVNDTEIDEALQDRKDLIDGLNNPLDSVDSTNAPLTDSSYRQKYIEKLNELKAIDRRIFGRKVDVIYASYEGKNIHLVSGTKITLPKALVDLTNGLSI